VPGHRSRPRRARSTGLAVSLASPELGDRRRPAPWVSHQSMATVLALASPGLGPVGGPRAVTREAAARHELGPPAERPAARVGCARARGSNGLGWRLDLVPDRRRPRPGGPAAQARAPQFAPGVSLASPVPSPQTTRPVRLGSESIGVPRTGRRSRGGRRAAGSLHSRLTDDFNQKATSWKFAWANV
jgi:hypothetical protein